MESELLRAVAIASAPPGVGGVDTSADLREQAMAYLEQLRANTHECWQPAWNVFAARADEGAAPAPRYGDNERMFALNLVQDFLENRVAQIENPAAAVAYLQEQALIYVHAEFVNGSGERGMSFMKNKVAQALSLLLVQTYSLPPPYTLLPTLLSLTRGSDNALNPTSTDLVLRILHDLSLTLGSDVTLRAVRSRERLARDGLVRDEIRTHNAPAVAEAVWAIVEESMGRVGSGVWPGKMAEDITELAVRVVGDYVSWTDISLMVTPATVQILFALLQHSVASLRLISADCLSEVITKGMKAPDKLELLRALDLTTVIGALESSTRTAASGGEPDVEFRERLARLANGISFELARVVEEPHLDDATKNAADEMLVRSLPLALAFLSDPYDEMAEQIMPCLNQVLALFKKARRTSPNASVEQLLSPDKRAFLESLIRVVLEKMKYDEEAEWFGDSEPVGSEDGDEDEEAAQFLKLRKNLQVIIAAIAAVDEPLFAARVPALIMDTLTQCDAGLSGAGPQITWQQAELALYVAHWYGELLCTASGQPKTGVTAASFVQMRASVAKPARGKPQPATAYATYPLNALGETIQRLVQSHISSFPHSAVQLQYFECAVRYASFFTARPERIADALPAFLDARGLHHVKPGVRHRVNYLFFRFLSATKGILSPDFVRGLLESIQDLLVVQAELPPAKPDEDVLAKALGSVGAFDSQLHLFEGSGMLLALLKPQPDVQLTLLKAIVDPLLVQMQQALQAYSANSQDLRLVLQTHHLFLATSNLSKGFPDNTATPDAAPAWVQVFKSVTEQILVSLGELKRFSIIRIAARGAFSRMVAKCGDVVLPYLPALLTALLEDVTAQELVEVLAFTGLMTARYKTMILPIMDDLLSVLVARVFHFLNQDVTGTDDAMQRSELTQAYLTLLSALFHNKLDSVLYSDKNKPQLEAVLQSLVFYTSSSDVNTQRAAFSVLARFVAAWGGTGAVAAGANGAAATPQPLPGFEQYIYETFVPLCFEAPAKPNFDFADAQSQQVLSEICSLLKTILDVRGDEALEFLSSVYFPRIGCPPDMAAEFVNNLKVLDVKALRKALQAFIKISRGGR